MSRINDYYYNQLNKEQQKVYYAVMTGISKMQDSFQVPRTDAKDLSDIYFMVRMDHPELGYSVTYRYRYYDDSNYVELIPEYLFTKDKLKSQCQGLQSRIKKLARPAAELSDREKIMYVHDFIAGNVTYDKLKKEYSHEIIGALGNGVAVCEGMAKAVKALCDELDIWCIVALSENNPEKGIKYRHAWNIIKLGEKYYHMDATFDNNLSKCGVIRSDYAFLSDKQLFRDHEPVIWRVPECDDGGNFRYKEKKMSWTSLEEVRKRTGQAVKKGKPLLFHWRGGFLTNDVLKSIVEIFREESEAKNKTAVCSVNRSQAVIFAKFENRTIGENSEIKALEEDEDLAELT